MSYRVKMAFSITIDDSTFPDPIYKNGQEIISIVHDTPELENMLTSFLNNVDDHQRNSFHSLLTPTDISHETSPLLNAISVWNDKYKVPPTTDSDVIIKWFLQRKYAVLELMYNDLIEIVQSYKVNIPFNYNNKPKTIAGMTTLLFGLLHVVFGLQDGFLPVMMWDLETPDFTTKDEIIKHFKLSNNKVETAELFELQPLTPSLSNGGLIRLYFSVIKLFKLTPLIDLPPTKPYSADYLGKIYDASADEETVDIICGQILDALYKSNDNA